MNKTYFMDYNEMMRKRTFEMSISVYKLFKTKQSMVETPAIQQIIKSSSSVSANFHAATRGRSDKEFYSKLCVVVEECDETLFWLNYFLQIGFFQESEISKIRDEVTQILKMLSKSKYKMKMKTRSL